MNTIKFISLFLTVSLISLITGADPYRGRDDHRDYRNHGYYDGGRRYGYYRTPRGEWTFGILGTWVGAGIIINSQRPVYVPPPPQIVYVPPPPPVYVEQPVMVTINIQNSNGSMTPVVLRRVGNQWVGPRGEYYDAFPSVGQLRSIYGF